jgi:hypothetical protein
LLEGSAGLSFQLRQPSAGLLSIHRHDRFHELCLTGEMVVNAGFTDMHGVRDVGIAEAVIPPDGQESLGARDDFPGFVRELNVHARKSTN